MIKPPACWGADVSIEIYDLSLLFSIITPRIKPAFFQDRACVTSNDVPHIHWDWILSNGQLYLILMASQNSCFINSYQCSFISQFVNQFETPFWLRVSIILFVFSSDVARNCRYFSWFLVSSSALISPLSREQLPLCKLRNTHLYCTLDKLFSLL